MNTSSIEEEIQLKSFEKSFVERSIWEIIMMIVIKWRNMLLL
jgi:hypothetical protein